MKKEIEFLKGKTKRLLFSLNLRKLTLGQKDQELSKVQTLLSRLGYLVETYQPEILDDATHRALKIFQAFQGLEPTGLMNEETLESLKAPRCGNEDLPGLTPDALAAFSLDDFAPDLKRGCAFHGVPTLTYTIEYTPQLGGLSFADVKGAIDKAFTTWEKEIPINLKPAQGDGNATFKLKWATGNHGDGESKKFDGVGSLLAHAFYPPDCNETFTGQCHFDDEETWGLFDDSDTGKIDLQTVALHEIGHLLGLTHSRDLNSVMVPKHMGVRRVLSPDVKIAIQSIYGIRIPA